MQEIIQFHPYRFVLYTLCRQLACREDQMNKPMKHLLIFLCCTLLGVTSCQKEEQKKKEKKVLLTKITRPDSSITYTYDETGRLTTALYQTEIGSYTATYTDYNHEGWLTSYVIDFAEDEETDLHCKNTFDQQGRLVRVDQYRLDGGDLINYALIEYAEDLVTRKHYDGSSSLIMTDKFFLTEDGKNVAKRVFYNGDETVPTTTTTYPDYDDKRNPSALLPAGYNPWNLELSLNNLSAAIWVTKSVPAGTGVHYAYTYEYNADGYPVTSSRTSEFSTRIQQYEYQVK